MLSTGKSDKKNDIVRYFQRKSSLGPFSPARENSSNLMQGTPFYIGRSTLVGQHPMKSLSSVCPSVRAPLRLNH